MKKILFLLSAICIFVTILSACSSSDTPEDTEKKTAVPETPAPVLTIEETEIASQMSVFSLELFQATSANNDKNRNFVISPLNLATMLAVVANAGNSDAICNVLHCSDLLSLNEMTSKYMRWLPNAGGNVKMNFATSIWYNDKYSLQPDFARVASDVFSSDIYKRDFSNGNVSDEINAWASEKTDGMITDVKCHPEIIAILSALYFKGMWSVPFDEKNTVKTIFHSLKGDTETDMMRNRLLAAYHETTDAQLIKLDFGKSFYTIVVLPKENENIDDFIAEKLSKHWNDIKAADKLYPSEIDLSFPKFQIQPEGMELNEILSTLDLRDISANFLQETSSECQLKEFATVRFDEQGAEAASVITLVDGAAGPDTPINPIEMTVDRPFLFFISERNSGLCLFAGKVVNL